MTPRSLRSATLVPSNTTAPWSITYTRSASCSAISAFCSTSSMLTRWLFSSRMVSITALTIIGTLRVSFASKASHAVLALRAYRT